MQLQSAADEQELILDDALLETENGLLHPVNRLPLEHHLRRRPAAMPPPKRRVTLQELIDQLQIMANQLKLVQKQINQSVLAVSRLCKVCEPR